MWKPWAWSQRSNDRAVGNARLASTELGRLRVERQEVELFLAQHREVGAALGRSIRRPA